MIEGFHLLFHESGLAPLFHPLSPSFVLFQSEKPLFWGVPGVSQCLSLVRICPRDLFTSRKKKINCTSYKKKGAIDFVISFVEVFSLIFTQPA